MKLLIPALLFSAIIMSCGGNSSDKKFEIRISTDRGTTELYYVLNETSLEVYRITVDSSSNDTSSVFQSVLNTTDTLELIAKLDIQSHSCSDQHALDVRSVHFKNNKSDADVDPYVNHPKELDYAVRLINSIVDEELHLEFIDMQSAIEPTDKHRM